MIATADSALGQVSNLLNDIRGLVVEAANSGALSEDEIAANQLQVDSSLEAINRIARTTTFQGRRLLDGSLDFITDADSVANLVNLDIDQANLGANGSVDVNVSISSAATQAAITATSGSGNEAFTAGAAATTALVFQLSGASGAEVFNFESGASVNEVVAAVQLVSDATGVTASNSNGTLNLNSTRYGSGEFVDVEVISEGAAGEFGTDVSAARAIGADIIATVNGISANGEGNRSYLVP